MADTLYPFSHGTEGAKVLEKLSDSDKNIVLAEVGVIDDAITENTINRIRNLLDVPSIPQSWEQDPKLQERCQSLLKVIQANPEWWAEWKNKIELKDDGIDFKELGFILELYDLPEKKSWGELENMYGKSLIDVVPDIFEYEKLYDFINSAGRSLSGYLSSFLGFGTYSHYWSSTEHYYLGHSTNIALHCSLDGSYFHRGKDRKNNPLCVRCIHRY